MVALFLLVLIVGTAVRPAFHNFVDTAVERETVGMQSEIDNMRADLARLLAMAAEANIESGVMDEDDATPGDDMMGRLDSLFGDQASFEDGLKSMFMFMLMTMMDPDGAFVDGFRVEGMDNYGADGMDEPCWDSERMKPGSDASGDMAWCP